MKKLTLVLSFFLFVSFPTIKSYGFTLLGGETLGVSENAFRVGAGFPNLYGAYHMPITDGFEVIPKFTFFYGADTTVPDVGDTFGMELKFRLIQSGGFALSLFADPAFIVAYHPNLSMGFRIGAPGVITSYCFKGKYYLIGGLKIPFGFLFYTKGPGKDFVAMIPIMFTLGGEFQLSNDFNFFFVMDMGPTIYAGSGGSATEFTPIVNIGFSYRF